MEQIQADVLELARNLLLENKSLYLQMILKLDTFPHLSVLFQLCLMHMQNIHESKYKQSLSNHTLELLQFQGLSN